MAPRNRRWFAGGALAVALATAQLTGTAPAVAAPAAAARILYYDASRATEFGAAIAQGAANWNARVSNVQLRPVPTGTRANITVLVDDGWPRAITTSLGNGRWYMGRTAVRDGHNPTRIAAHEFGHLLGLPDRRTGRCTDLMSGASAGPTCTNAFPNAAEAREVEARFARFAPATAPVDAVTVD
jgi:snapalysin